MLNTSERNAISKAQQMGGAAVVQRIRQGLYTVPSATEAGVFYTITGTAMDASDHTCDCPAGLHGHACWHVSAVRLAPASRSRACARTWRPGALPPG